MLAPRVRHTFSLQFKMVNMLICGHYRNYEQLLSILCALKAWFRQYQDDYEALHHALSNRDAATAEEIQRDLEEPSEYGLPTEEESELDLGGDSEMEDDSEDGSESGFEDDPEQS